jgi:hypothetical protein
MATAAAANVNTQFAEKIADRLLRGTAPFPYDVSTINTTFKEYQPTVPPRLYAGVNSYNGMSTRFSITVPAGSKLVLDKSFVRLRLQLCSVAHPPVAPVAPVAVADGASIGCPWNPLCVMSTAEYNLSNGVLVGSIKENLDWSTTIMRLLDTSREVMNHSPERFITPCIESVQDLATTFSPESVSRTLTFVDSGGAAIAREFMIPLSDLFGELAYPVDWTCNRFDCTFMFKAPEDTSIVFKTFDAVGTWPALIVGDCQLVMNVAQLSPQGEAIELSRLKPEATLLRVAAVYADTKPFAYGPSTYTDNLVSNCIGAVLTMPIPPVADGALADDNTGVNPMQSMLNFTGIQFKLGSHIHEPEDRLVIDTTNRLVNKRLYTMYTKLCNRLASSNSHYITTALDANDIQFNPPAAGDPDLSPYGIACAGFFDDTASLHRTLDGAQLEILPTGGIAWAEARVARIRVKYITISGDYRVTLLE